MYEIRLHVCERMINMVGGTFGITGQKQYRNDLGQVPGYDKFAEDKKFIELNDLDNTEYNLPIRHFAVGNGNNDIVITRCNSWKRNNYNRFYIEIND